MAWKKLLPIACLAALFIILARSVPAGASSPVHHVRIAAGAVQDAAELGLNPRVAVDYGTFQWLSLNEADFARLEASGVPYSVAPDAGRVQANAFAFDPVVDGEPAIPAGLRATGGGHGFHLIQLVGPGNDPWLSQLKAAGLRPLQYYPSNAYLVWADGAAVERVADNAFVRWHGAFHPAYKPDPYLYQRAGRISNVDVMFYNDGNIENTVAELEALGAEILNLYPSQPDRAFFNAIVRLDAAQIDAVARLNAVLWLGYSGPQPILDDEMSAQIVAGNHPGGVPETGYNQHLTDLGYDGSGVTWSINDTGVDYNHPDLNSRIVGGRSYPSCPQSPPGDDPATGGHGTHVAGIVGGDATAGIADGDGFLYGLGVAPGYSIFAQNPICSGSVSWPPAGGWQEISKWAVLGGAVGGNNSWTTGEGTQHGYQASERTHDIMVRDGNFDTAAVAEPFIEVFSAGNSGSSGLTAPKEGKNLIVTASSRNYRAGDIDTISGFSSIGPAVDGRWVPTISAPGESIISTRNDDGGSCGTPISDPNDPNNYYSSCSGTSMAAPHASGVIVVTTEWWRTFNSGDDPSPAMAKALLVNHAVDMGAADIPNINEGWGRVNLTNIIDPGVEMVYRDQLDLFQNTGEQYTLSFGVPDPSRPLKITLAWSDAPGAVGANPALVNDLNLTVTNGGTTYLGNVFTAGWSATGGTADAINNLENVYIENPSASATIVVDAVNIAGDGVPYNGDDTDQDFVIVCQNCALFPDFTLNADPMAQAVCTPDDATYTINVGQILGYTDPVTLSAGGNPAGTTVSFSDNPVTPSDPPSTSTLTIGNTGAATAGSYAIDVVGVAPTSTHTTTVGLDLYTAVPGTPALQSPADGAVNAPFRPIFSWTGAAQAATYVVQVATDAAFSNVVYEATETGTTHEMDAPLNADTLYYWRVTAENTCGTEASTAFTFTTQASSLICNGSTVDFEGGIPADWIVGDNTGGSGIVWTTTADTACGIPNRTNGSGEAACADSDAAGSGAPAFSTELWTPLLDLSGQQDAVLDVKAYYRDLNAGSNDRFEVDVWDGSTWTTELSWDDDYEPADIQLDLSAYTGAPEVRVRFHYFGNGYDWYAQVDDVSLTCTPAGPMQYRYLPIITRP